MPIPRAQPKYYERDLTTRTIDNIINTLEGELRDSDFNKVSCAASIQFGIELQKQSYNERSDVSLPSAEHKSERLARNLEQKFGPRPSKVHAHAMVAGKHKLAARLRLRMEELKIGIDEADNGCWLPENSAATPHPLMKKAPPHSRIHRHNYYFWLDAQLINITDATKFRNRLKLTALSLYQGSFPPYVMLKKGQGLPNGGRV